MKVKFRAVDDAYTVANAGKYGDITILLDKAGGTFYSQPNNDEDVKIPAEIRDSVHVIPLPNKNDLDLGTKLVFRFIREVFPAGNDKVSEIFTRRGAYGRYKKWLMANNLLEKWVAYSTAAEEAALREWCADNGIELED